MSGANQIFATEILIDLGGAATKLNRVNIYDSPGMKFGQPCCKIVVRVMQGLHRILSIWKLPKIPHAQLTVVRKIAAASAGDYPQNPHGYRKDDDMTPQERQLLQDLLMQLTEAKGIAKDPEADALINSVTTRQPDALYLLVQHSLLQAQALNTAQAQITRLQNESQGNKSVTGNSFLDSGGAWGRQNADAPRAQQAAPMFGAAPSTVAKPGFLSGGAGGLLGSVAATAAGIAGGAFLFQGIENLMGHHNAGSGLLGHDDPQTVVGNTTINNYYSSDDAATDDVSIDEDSDNGDDSSGADDSMSA